MEKDRMHDEFERAVTGGTPRRGLSPFGWVLVTFGVFVTDENRVEAAFGDEAERMPSRAAGLVGAPGRAQPVISLDSDRGRLGAVAWESDEDASTLLASFLESLEAEGYEVKVEHRGRDGAETHGSLWARHEEVGRMVFMVAHRDDRGRTGVLLGYGEQR